MTKANQHDADHEPPLHQISVGDLNSRGAWERLITTLREVHVANPSCALNIFGEGQNQYLVVNIYDSDTSSTEFFFSAHDELQRLDVLMEALETIGYSLARLIEDCKIDACLELKELSNEKTDHHRQDRES